MDPKFHPAVAAIKAGDLERFRTLLREDPSRPASTTPARDCIMPRWTATGPWWNTSWRTVPIRASKTRR